MIRFGLMLFCTAAVSCSLGTEVGNGLRPKQPSPTSPETTSDRGNSPSGDSPSGKMAEPQAGPVQTDSSPVANTKRTTDLVWSLITTACGSPWAQPLESPIELVADRGEFAPQTLVRGDYDASTQTWTLRDNQDMIRYRLQPRPAVNADATLVLGPDNQPVVQDTTCSSVSEQTDVSISGVSDKVTEKTVTLTHQGTAYVMKWYLQNGEGQKILRQVDLQVGSELIYRLQAK